MRINFWKASTLALTGVLVLVLSRDAFSSAEAAGPKRLSAALSALKSSKKHLEEAKDPPAAFHAKSMTSVDNAIAAVEREIKALEDGAAKAKAKDAKDKEKDGKDSKKSDKSAKNDKSDKPEKSEKKTHHETEVDD